MPWKMPTQPRVAAKNPFTIKYRERNEVQRWLFRRELEPLPPARVYYLDEGGVDHRLYREYGRAPRGERIYETVAGRCRERTSVIAAYQNGRLVAPVPPVQLQLGETAKVSSETTTVPDSTGTQN